MPISIAWLNSFIKAGMHARSLAHAHEHDAMLKETSATSGHLAVPQAHPHPTFIMTTPTCDATPFLCGAHMISRRPPTGASARGLFFGATRIIRRWAMADDTMHTHRQAAASLARHVK
eukprot:CAMPEP_0183361514 /NCGR_PEP_ID=MMETSP0164_2-20130417/61342_1 /TAXON_ID=221442 /ORGANISM="Coccolithus pelagicus ssp braarudi, Strain PLY182g" /LENGTH=117 /DNA_ID=CAMNT_0025536119 /DNA_START=148 /DNA_END=501 /DNA_ORIENTATION=+